jgi:putative YhdH/YhfP family quinone oxidoreductase
VDKFKVYRLREADRKVTAAFEQATVDELDAGEVVVRVAYSCVNYKDALAATGAGRIIRRFPCIGGIDLAGTVVESSDPRFRKGDAVIGTSYDIGVAHDGGYAEYARVKADWLVPMPKGMSFFEAGVGTAGFTAGSRSSDGAQRPRAGRRPVIVNGATGGVGSIALAALAKLGYHVVALTGKESESDWLKKLGAKEIMLRQSLNLQKIKPLDKATWAGAVDNLGGDVLAWMASTMNYGGVIAAVGLAASYTLNTTVMPFILRGVSLLGVNSGDVSNPIRDLVWRRLATDLKPPLLKEMARTIRFAELPSVFDDFINAKVSRRVVVDIAE